MSSNFAVVNTELKDLADIIRWFDESIAYQERRGYPSWRNYDQDAVRRDIEKKNSYKVVNENGAGIAFSVNYRDPVIWRHMDDGLSLYLHRIVVNPGFKGQKLFGVVLDWAIRHSRQKNLTNIRMDTWANNPNIINYYKTFGFEVIEDFTTPDVEELPVHNRNLALTLLEFRGSI
jgi:ribosomal protein S18 acetylase RimI-like enzyme